MKPKGTPEIIWLAQFILMDKITGFFFPFRIFGIGILRIQSGLPLPPVKQN